MTDLLVLVGGGAATWAAWCAAWSAAFDRVALTLPNPKLRPDHLERVGAEMRTLGRPRLRGVRDGDRWLLVEGSHRAAAAVRARIGVEIVEVDPTRRSRAGTTGRRIARPTVTGTCGRSMRRPPSC